MLLPFYPLLFGEPDITNRREPSRLSSDRGVPNSTPLGVDELYAPDAPGEAPPDGQILQKWPANGRMVQRPAQMYVRYEITVKDFERSRASSGSLTSTRPSSSLTRVRQPR